MSTVFKRFISFIGKVMPEHLPGGYPAAVKSAAERAEKMVSISLLLTIDHWTEVVPVIVLRMLGLRRLPSSMYDYVLNWI